jgi:hypothetical protein
MCVVLRVTIWSEQPLFLKQSNDLQCSRYSGSSLLVLLISVLSFPTLTTRCKVHRG